MISPRTRRSAAGFSLPLLCSSIAFAAGQPPAGQPPKLRLSEVESIDPTAYRADLTLNPESDTFTGSITIRMNIKQATQTIWLEQEKITVQSATLTAGTQTMTAHSIPGGDDFVGFQFDSPVPTGPAEFKIGYSGQVIRRNSSAVFRQQDSGNWYIFSQFEPTDARAAFPCFDEPSYKTPWQLTLHIPAKDTAISNTSVESEKTDGDSKTIVFHQTLPLPSYLVAFGVGPFEFVDAGTAGQNHVPVRIVVPKGHMDEAKYAAEISAAIITHHEKYFGYPYPYDKADQVAVPDTSGWGAMENPGMVTYAQNIILAKPDRDTINRQRDYAVTAAHELAHQWFGDLVTTAWWNDIWLNEAFATWMEQKWTAEVHPEWNTVVSDVASKLYAEREDSLISARKIRQPIEAKDDISNAFDGITYQKGAAVIGMFESWMGPKEFQKGVQSYMKQYAFKATTAGEFLDSISSAAHKDVTKPFSTFLNQAGVPLVSVALRCDSGAPALHLEQSRYLPLGSKGSADQLWSIPVCVSYGTGDRGQNECTLMTEPKADLPLKTASCPAWVQANAGALGYYRVDYPSSLLNALTDGDADKRLDAAERADLIGNAAALSSGGKLPEADALALVEKFHADPERQVVTTAITLALAPRQYLVSKELEANYQRFLLKNFQARAHELGWIPKPGESDDTLLLRPVLLRMVATWGGDQQLAAEAKSLTQKWLQDHSSIDANTVDAVLGATAFYSDQSLFERFLREFEETQDRQTRRHLITAMTSFRDPAAIQAGMQAVLDKKVPFIQGASLLFNGQQQAATRNLPFDFLKAHFDQITREMPGGGGFDFGSVLPRVGASYCDADSKTKLQNFFQPRVDKFVGLPRALNQTLEAIDLCIADVAAQKPSVAAFLQKY